MGDDPNDNQDEYMMVKVIGQGRQVEKDDSCSSRQVDLCRFTLSCLLTVHNIMAWCQDVTAWCHDVIWCLWAMKLTGGGMAREGALMLEVFILNYDQNTLVIKLIGVPCKRNQGAFSRPRWSFYLESISTFPSQLFHVHIASRQAVLGMVESYKQQE